MVLVNVLKRKDASSIVVAVLVALILIEPITTVTSQLASKISGLPYGLQNGSGGGSTFKTDYLLPVVSAILEVLVLELLGWVCVWVNMSMKGKKS